MHYIWNSSIFSKNQIFVTPLCKSTSGGLLLMLYFSSVFLWCNYSMIVVVWHLRFNKCCLFILFHIFNAFICHTFDFLMFSVGINGFKWNTGCKWVKQVSLFSPAWFRSKLRDMFRFVNNCLLLTINTTRQCDWHFWSLISTSQN